MKNSERSYSSIESNFLIGQVESKYRWNDYVKYYPYFSKKLNFSSKTFSLVFSNEYIVAFSGNRSFLAESFSNSAKFNDSKSEPPFQLNPSLNLDFDLGFS